MSEMEIAGTLKIWPAPWRVAFRDEGELKDKSVLDASGAELVRCTNVYILDLIVAAVNNYAKSQEAPNG